MTNSDQVLPPDPNASGWHWLEDSSGEQFVAYWRAPAKQWFASWGGLSAQHAASLGLRYLRPVPTPARIAALEAEIGRLQVAFRVNAMRLGFTESVIDEILHPDGRKGDGA